MSNITELHDRWLTKYELTHPKPVSRSTRLEKLQWFIILTAVVFYSSDHNISFLTGTDEGIKSILKSVAIVIMIEGILIKAGERLAKYLPTEKMHNTRLVMVLLLGVMSLIVAISGNVFDLLQSKNFYISPNLETWVLILVGITAPLMAVFAGVMFTSIEAEQSEEMDKWMLNMRREWSKFENKNNITIQISKPSTQLPNGNGKSGNIPQIPDSNSNWNGNGKSGSGYNRTSTAMEQALEHYRANPDDLDRSPLEICREIGVSKSTMYNARNTIKEELGID